MKFKTKIFFLALISLIAISSLVSALPTGPIVTYISNSTASTVLTNRSQDAKGTITVLDLNALQQDYKWKAYVGNVTGKLALDDATGKSIYDWTMGTISGNVYVTLSNSVAWTSIGCANQTTLDTAETGVGMSNTMPDSINSTFPYNIHRSFLVGTTNITNSTCRSTDTYINGTAHIVAENSTFQEVLLQDNTAGSLIYTTLINPQQLGYDGVNSYDFQLLVAENESATVPLTYYFYVELG